MSPLTWSKPGGILPLAEVLHLDGQLDAGQSISGHVAVSPEDAGTTTISASFSSIKQNRRRCGAISRSSSIPPKCGQLAKTWNVSYAQADLDGAIAEYRTALELNPEEPNAHALLGIVLGRKGNLEGAITEFKQFITKNPEHAFAHANLVMRSC